MPKADTEELAKHTLHLYAGDYARLQDTYPEIGAAKVIRKLVRHHLNNVDPAVDLTQIKGDSIG